MENITRRLLHGTVGAVLGSIIGLAIGALLDLDFGNTYWKIVGFSGAGCFAVGFLFGKQAIEWLKEIAESLP